MGSLVSHILTEDKIRSSMKGPLSELGTNPHNLYCQYDQNCSKRSECSSSLHILGLCEMIEESCPEKLACSKPNLMNPSIEQATEEVINDAAAVPSMKQNIAKHDIQIKEQKQTDRKGLHTKPGNRTVFTKQMNSKSPIPRTSNINSNHRGIRTSTSELITRLKAKSKQNSRSGLKSFKPSTTTIYEENEDLEASDTDVYKGSLVPRDGNANENSNGTVYKENKILLSLGTEVVNGSSPDIKDNLNASGSVRTKNKSQQALNTEVAKTTKLPDLIGQDLWIEELLEFGFDKSEILEKRKSLLQITANFKSHNDKEFVKMKYKLNFVTKEETFTSDCGVERLLEFDLDMDKNGNPDPKLFPKCIPKLMNRFEGTVLLDGYLISMDTQQSQRYKVIDLDVYAEPPVLMISPKSVNGLDIVRSSSKLEIRVESEFGPEDPKCIRIEGEKASQIKTVPGGGKKLLILLA